MESTDTYTLSEEELNELRLLQEKLHDAEIKCHKAMSFYEELESIILEKQNKLDSDSETSIPCGSKSSQNMKVVNKKMSSPSVHKKIGVKHSKTNITSKGSRTSIKSKKSISPEDQSLVRDRIEHIHELITRISKLNTMSPEEKAFRDMFTYKEGEEHS